MFPNLLIISSDLVEFSNVFSIVVVVIFLTFTSIILLRIWQRDILNNRHDINALKNGLKNLKSIDMTAVDFPFTVLIDDTYASNLNDGCYIKTHCMIPDALLWPLWGVNSAHLFEMLNYPWDRWKQLLLNKSFLNCLYQGEPIILRPPSASKESNIHDLFQNTHTFDHMDQSSHNSQDNRNNTWQKIHLKKPKFLKEQLLGTAPRTRYPLVLVAFRNVMPDISKQITSTQPACPSKIGPSPDSTINESRGRRRSLRCKKLASSDAITPELERYDEPNRDDSQFDTHNGNFQGRDYFSDSEADDNLIQRSPLMVTTRSYHESIPSQQQFITTNSSQAKNLTASTCCDINTKMSYHIVASVCIIHLQDAISCQPSSIMGQYLKSRDESIYILQQLYMMSPEGGGSGTSLSPVGRPRRRRHPTRACVACGEREADQVILPCRHVCVCRLCLRKLDKCPMCRGPLQSFWVLTT